MANYLLLQKNILNSVTKNLKMDEQDDKYKN